METWLRVYVCLLVWKVGGLDMGKMEVGKLEVGSVWMVSVDVWT